MKKLHTIPKRGGKKSKKKERAIPFNPRHFNWLHN